MLNTARYAILVVGLAVLPASASAQKSSARLPQDIVFKAPPIAGYPELAAVYGDTAKPRVYVQRVKILARVQSHAALASGRCANHRGSVRHLVLLVWGHVG